ncbi:phage Gp37/Gp68 family protein [Haloferula sp.]|uniref:phage Gp37/Gp68 family protein n=1 Tax=Haloferula sp. TaxID=2497595 RepID=UPI003C71DAA1
MDFKSENKTIMENSKIEWTHHTFNPWMGCTKVSPGCLHCYAETLMDTRYGRVKWGKGQPRSRTGKENWRKPHQWNRAAADAIERPRVFCASLADWLDDEVDVEWLADLLSLIAETPNLDWLLLTKRPQAFARRMKAVALLTKHPASVLAQRWGEMEQAPPNVWVGTSAEDQIRWDERMSLLMSIPARVRFVSAEPLLGRIHMDGIRPDWLIVGGESGPGARPMEREWVEHLRDQCDERTAFHFKQWGGVDKKTAGRELDGRTWDQLPSITS